MKEKKQRPVNLDLQTIRFPITAIASILHRISGVTSFLLIALLLWLLHLSLHSQADFNGVAEMMDGFVIKIILWLMGVGLFYHLVLGIRHLIMDLGHFEEMASGEKSAKVSFVIVAICALIVGGIVW